MNFSHTTDPEALFATVRSHFERAKPGLWMQLTAHERLELFNLYELYERKRNDATTALSQYEITALTTIEKVRQRNVSVGERTADFGKPPTSV